MKLKNCSVITCCPLCFIHRPNFFATLQNVFFFYFKMPSHPMMVRLSSMWCVAGCKLHPYAKIHKLDHGCLEQENQYLHWRTFVKDEDDIYLLCLIYCTSVHQLQMASTASFFITRGHGSPPKASGNTVTEHHCCPTQFCNRPRCYTPTNIRGKMQQNYMCMLKYR